MSKLSRITSNLFASTSTTAQIGVFGSFASGTPTFTTNPATAQSLSNWLEGWFAAIEGNSNPAIEDMNAFCFVLSYLVCYLNQTGVSEWDSGTTYFIGSLANDGFGNLYVSLTDNNLNNSLTSGTNWAIQGNQFSTVTTSTTITAAPQFVRSNSTSGALTMTLPAIASTPPGTKITIKDVGSGAHATTIVGHGSELIDGNNTYSSVLNQYDSVTLFANGTSWDII